MLVDLTPLLTGIDTDGNRWVWKMMGISALGVEVAPCFTERMEFTPEQRIDFTHTPPDGGTERAGADGVYRLEDHDDGTLLDIEITISVDLPLPRMSRRRRRAGHGPDHGTHRRPLRSQPVRPPRGAPAGLTPGRPGHMPSASSGGRWS